MFKKYFFSFIVVLVLTTSGCGTPNISSSAIVLPQNLESIEVAVKQSDAGGISRQKNIKHPPIELTEELNGGVIALKIHDIVSVKIDGAPTTGYIWEVENLDINLLQQSGEAESVPNKNLPGSGRFFTFTFEAVGTGLTHLRLIYHRPFEKNTPPFRIFDVTVDIQ